MKGKAEHRRIHLFNEPGEIVELCRELAGDPLPAGTLIVPHDSLKHALRRSAGRDLARILTGWRMLTPLEAAMEVLQAAGVSAAPGTDQLASFAIEALFAADVLEGCLEYFQLDQLRSGSGYAVAFAATLRSLAEAGCTPEMLLEAATSLEAETEKRVRDIATIWKSSAEQATRPSQVALFAEAAQLLGDNADSWLWPGPVLVWLSHPNEAQLCFLAAIPGAEAVLLRSRPLRPEYMELLARVQDAFEDDSLIGRMTQPFPQSDHRREIDLARTLTFESPETLGADRPRSQGADGTVQFEIHPGVEAELEAAVDWVAQEVFERRTPLDEIAILLPTPDPLAGMLVERLRNLPWYEKTGDDPPVFVAGGLSVVRYTTACRIDAILLTLENALSAESLRSVLPALARVSFNRAGEVVYSCGETGGTPGNPGAGLRWPDAFESRMASFEKEIKVLRAGISDDDSEASKHVRGLSQLERLLAGFTELLPNVRAMVAVYQTVHDDRSLKEIWPLFRELVEQHVRRVPTDPPILESLNEAVAPLASLVLVESLRGRAAVRAIRDLLRKTRMPLGKFGEPRIFVGDLHAATGHTFRAVRLIGLCEGNIPTNPREDAVLPDNERAILRKHTGAPMELAGDRVVQQLHAFHQAIRSARERIVLSLPREWVDAVGREPSAVVLEVASALGRGLEIPSMSELRRSYFALGRRQLDDFRSRTVLSAGAEHRRVASQSLGATRLVPGRWVASGMLDVSRLRDLHGQAGHGIHLDHGSLGKPVQGLTADRPVSAYRLQRLLECPYRFVLQDILHWEEPFHPPSMDEIDPMQYGTLLHLVMQRFYEEYGHAFRSDPTVRGDWMHLAESIARESFEAFQDQYPLAGAAAESHQWHRLMRDVRTLIEFDLQRPRSEVMATEHEFGFPDGTALQIGDAGTIYVRGYVDRVEVEPDTGTVIWDIKSGRLNSNEREAANPKTDIQLAIYLHALEAQRSQLNLPAVAGVHYVSPRDKGPRTRGFTSDGLQSLVGASAGWMEMALKLLKSGRFPHAADQDACRHCPFAPVCGDRIAKQSRVHLGSAPEESAEQDFLRFSSQRTMP